MHFSRLAVYTWGNLVVIWEHMLLQNRSAQHSLHAMDWTSQVTYGAF
jgi:hypothetical protein